jgi:hypothetical protein
MPPNACTPWDCSAPLQHAEPRGAVPDARSAVLHRGALEHSTGHACPASHAPRTSRPRMSKAVIAGTLVFVVPPGALLELCRSRGALAQTRCLWDSGAALHARRGRRGAGVAGEGEVRGATCRGAVCALLTRRRRLYAPGTLPCPCRWGILALEAAPAEAVWS